jgi:hypothetical protein
MFYRWSSIGSFVRVEEGREDESREIKAWCSLCQCKISCLFDVCVTTQDTIVAQWPGEATMERSATSQRDLRLAGWQLQGF